MNEGIAMCSSERQFLQQCSLVKSLFPLGSFTDRFVGGLSEDGLQQFILRLCTGYGSRAMSEMSEAGLSNELSQLTDKINRCMDQAALSFNKKERLLKLVDEALAMEDSISPEALKATLLYLKNVASDIRNKKYRSIKVSSKVYSEIIKSSAACMKLLAVAGFKEQTASLTSNFGVYLEIVHSNRAIIEAVMQRISESTARKRFSPPKK